MNSSRDIPSIDRSKIRKCSKCNMNLPATSEFFPIKKECKQGLSNICKECKREYDKRRNKRYLYGLSSKEFNSMILKQNNQCAICGRKFKNDFNQFYAFVPRVDHNHKTGENRGLLCDRCNLLLGKANDNIFILIKAIKYLKKYQNLNG